MKAVALITIMCSSFPVVSQFFAFEMGGATPAQCTVTIYYCACTDGGDFSVDSGEVVVPVQLRPAYIDALSKRGKLYGTREQIIERATRNKYRVSSLRAASVAARDSLFTPPKSGHYTSAPEAEDRTIQGGYWRRRYRITGDVVGLNGPYAVFKIRKAVRIADVNNEEK
jgi:hypothetical protein